MSKGHSLSLWAAHYSVEQVKTGRKLPYTLRAIVGNNRKRPAWATSFISNIQKPAFCFTPDAEFPLICGEKGVYHAQFTSPKDRQTARRLLSDGGTVPNAIPGLASALVRADASTLADTDSIQG